MNLAFAIREDANLLENNESNKYSHVSSASFKFRSEALL